MNNMHIHAHGPARHLMLAGYQFDGQSFAAIVRDLSEFLQRIGRLKYDPQTLTPLARQVIALDDNATDEIGALPDFARKELLKQIPGDVLLVTSGVDSISGWLRPLLCVCLNDPGSPDWSVRCLFTKDDVLSMYGPQVLATV